MYIQLNLHWILDLHSVYQSVRVGYWNTPLILGSYLFCLSYKYSVATYNHHLNNMLCSV